MKSFNTLLLILVLLTFLVTPSQLFAQKDKSTAGKSESKGKSTMGKVETIKTNNLTIVESKTQGKVETTIDKNTKVIGANRKVTTLKQLKLNDKVAIISSDSATASGSATKKASKIFVKQASDSAALKRKAVHGVVVGITGSTLTLVHQIHQDRVSTVSVTAATEIKIKGTQAGTLASITVGQRIVAMGDQGEGGVLVAKRIHVIPGKAKGVFKAVTLTPAAGTPSASTSPTITQTITPSLTKTPTATPPATTASPSATPAL